MKAKTLMMFAALAGALPGLAAPPLPGLGADGVGLTVSGI